MMCDRPCGGPIKRLPSGGHSTFSPKFLFS
jgi:hypothetical protein